MAAAVVAMTRDYKDQTRTHGHDDYHHDDSSDRGADSDGGDSDQGSVRSAAGSGWETFPERCCILHFWGRCKRSPEPCSYGPHLASAPESVKQLHFYKKLLKEHGGPNGGAGSGGPAAESAKAS